MPVIFFGSCAEMDRMSVSIIPARPRRSADYRPFFVNFYIKRMEVSSVFLGEAKTDRQVFVLDIGLDFVDHGFEAVSIEFSGLHVRPDLIVKYLDGQHPSALGIERVIRLGDVAFDHRGFDGLVVVL